jgi:segregation and condensation protein A
VSDPRDEVAAAPAAEGETPAYQVRLPKFEGPLDLLLHLIKRDEVDIYDIPIARITEQYLAFLNLMRELNLDVASEFLVMAATLMRIKVKMLLPATPMEEEEEQGDPREALVQQLLEYRKFKEVALRLREREESRRQLYERGLPESLDRDEPLPLRPVSLFDLLEVFRKVQTRAVLDATAYEVQGPGVYIEDCMERIRLELADRGRALFTELLRRCRRRVEMIVTFMALLELMRLGEVHAEQEEALGDIWIQSTRPAGA